MRNILLLYLVFLGTILVHAQNPLITAAELREMVYVLASDSLEGRKPGEMGGQKTEAYLQGLFLKKGLQAPGGGVQPFEVITGIRMGTSNVFDCSACKAEAGGNFIPAPWTGEMRISSEVYDAGYGFRVKKDSIDMDDYKAGEVKGKWAVIRRGIPAGSPYAAALREFSSDRDKALLAKDLGASGILFYNEIQDGRTEVLPDLLYDKSSAALPLPAFYITSDLASCLKKSGTFLTAQADIDLMHAITNNIWALIPGSDPVLKNEYIVAGAHYDHLGYGGSGSGSRMPDTNAVHYGADDNASGVAGILEMGEYLSGQRQRLGRSVILVAFGAEEMGLLGSSHFVKNLPVPASTVKAMVNFDMIGRLDPDSRSISIGGTGTSAEAVPLLDSLLKRSELKASYSTEGYGPSDHAPFYGAGIPVLYFNTGVHTDYHTPFDTPDRINYEGMQEVTVLAADLVIALSKLPTITYQEAGPRQRTSTRQTLKVTFGLMPDFTASGIKGLKASGITPGGPAAAAGMRKGDIITSIEGMPVGDIYEYMNRLKSLQPGQRVSVDILREDKPMVLILEL